MKQTKVLLYVLASSALILAGCSNQTASSSSTTSKDSSTSSSASESSTSSSASSSSTQSSSSEQSSSSQSSSSSSSSSSADTKDYVNDNWTSVGDAKAYYYDADGTIHSNVTEEIKNGGDHFIYAHTNYNINKSVLGANYKVSASYKGTYKGDVDAEIYAGVVAWYVDNNNYIVFATRWADWDRPSEIRSLFVTGMIGGEQYALSDFWTDNCGVAPADGVDLTITKTGAKFAYDLKGDGHDVKTGSITIDGTASDSAKAGILAANDDFSFTAYSSEAVVPETKFTYAATVDTVTYALTIDTSNLTYSLLAKEDGKSDVTTTGTYVADGRNLTLTASDTTVSYVKINDTAKTFEFYTPESKPADAVDVDGTAARKEVLIKDKMTGDYNLTYSFKGTITEAGHAVKVGFMPYYVDDDNYLELYVEWSATERSQEIREVQLTGKIGGTSVGYNDFWCDGSGVLVSDGFTMDVKLVGTDIAFVLTSGSWSKSDHASITGLDTSTAYSTKFYAEGDVISFYGVSFYSDISSNYDVTAPEGTTYTLRSDKMVLPTGVDILSKSTMDYDYTVTTSIAGTVNANVTTETKIGFHVWYVDADNYLDAYVEWSASDRPQEIREIQICGKIAGTATSYNDIWCDGSAVLPGDGLDLSITKAGKTFTAIAKSGNWTKTGNATFDTLPIDTAYKTGVYSLGDTFTLAHYTLDDSITLADGNSATYKTAHSGDYSLAFDFAGTVNENVTVNTRLGVSAWYVDDDNYLNAYVEWSASDRPQEIREIQICGKIAGTDTSYNDIWCDGSAVLPADSYHMTLTKAGNVFTVTLSSGNWSKTGNATFSTLPTDDTYNVGFYSVGDTFTISNYSLA